jgi:hypothetical protein
MKVSYYLFAVLLSLTYSVKAEGTCPPKIVTFPIRV